MSRIIPDFLKNPILVTRARIAMSRGLPAVVAVAALTVICALLMYFGGTHHLRLRAMAASYAAFLMMLQAGLLVIGAPIATYRAVREEADDGRLDANLLTSLTRVELLAGYWFGPMILLVAPACVLLLGVSVIAVVGRLDPAGFAAAQVAVFSTGALAGLFGLVIGLSTRSRSTVTAVFLSVLMLFAGTAPLGGKSLFQLLAPYALYREAVDTQIWRGFDIAVFGVPVPLAVAAFSIQALAFAFLLRAALRAFGDPMNREVSARSETLVAVGLFSFIQHGLLYSGRWSYASQPSQVLDLIGGVNIVAALVVTGAAFALLPSPSDLLRAARVEGPAAVAAVTKRSAIYVVGLGIAATLPSVTHLFVVDLFPNEALHVGIVRLLGGVLGGVSVVLVATGLRSLFVARYPKHGSAYGGLLLVSLIVFPLLAAAVFKEEDVGFLSLVSPPAATLFANVSTERLLAWSALAAYALLGVVAWSLARRAWGRRFA